MTYINVAMLAVKEADKDTYREMAAGMAALFKKHGALHVFENWGADNIASFGKAVDLQAGEGVVCSFIVWPSKGAREVGMQALMADPAIMDMSNDRPFDAARMLHGGFDAIVEI